MIVIQEKVSEKKIEKEKVVRLTLTIIALRLKTIENELANIVNTLSLIDFSKETVIDLKDAYENISKHRKIIEDLIDTELALKVIK